MSRNWVQNAQSTFAAAARNSALAALCIFLAPCAGAQDIGYEGLSYSLGGSVPSGSKPQSKLWFHDGTWWSSMWSDAFRQYRIHRLDTSMHAWIDSGTTLDIRKQSRADVLWDGTKLYVASHYYAATAAAGKPTWLYRLSFNAFANKFTPEIGFPVQINNYKTETVVIEKDSTGTLWATWVQDTKVYVNHTLGSDNLWGVPYQLPGTTNLTIDDLSSVIQFNGDRIGIAWSDQVSTHYWFSYHLDSDPDTTWSTPESMLADGFLADDHINLKADSLGQVYAALKSNGHVMLAVRRPDASWDRFIAGHHDEDFTRPIVVLNEEADELYFMASTDGTIYMKTSPLFNISFPQGRGTALMSDAEILEMDNSSSTKQYVDSTSGLVVIGSNQPIKRYWHAEVALTPPGPPVADFSVNLTQGEAPLPVLFTDSSTSRPTGWFWDFGDGATSSEQNPVHIYTVPGLYSVLLVATNDAGEDSLLETDLIDVLPPPPSITFYPVADTHVKSTSPNSNYGTQTTMRVRKTTTEEYRPYLKFDVSGITGTILSVKLRLFVTDGTPDGGTVYAIDPQWIETTITWNNAPQPAGNPLGSFGNVTANSWAALDLTAAVLGDGSYSFALLSNDSNSGFYQSRENTSLPELVISYQPEGP